MAEIQRFLDTVAGEKQCSRGDAENGAPAKTARNFQRDGGLRIDGGRLFLRAIALRGPDFIRQHIFIGVAIMPGGRKAVVEA